MGKQTKQKFFGATRLGLIVFLHTAAFLNFQLPLVKAQIVIQSKPNLEYLVSLAANKQAEPVILVKRFEFEGNTAFSNAELNSVVAPYLERPLSFTELLKTGKAITQFYTDHGYITSGAFIPANQTFVPNNLVVKIQIVEGLPERIEVKGTQQVNPDYVKFRIQLGAKKPLKVDQLVDQLKLLKSELLFKDVQATLKAGSTPGQSILIVHVTEVDYEKIAALMEQLKNKDQKKRLEALDSFVKIGAPEAIAAAVKNIREEDKATAVPVLITNLKHPNIEVRSSAALLLGRTGAEASAAIPDLIAVIKKSDGNYVADALGKIAISLQNKANANALSSSDLDKAISNLDAAVKILEAPKNEFSKENIASVSLSLNFLKAKRNERLLIYGILKNPWVLGTTIYIIFIPTFCFLLLRFRPLWLLNINDALKPYTDFTLPASLGGMKLPLRFVLFVGFFHYHPRVLDAWVSARIDSAKEGFLKKNTVSDRAVHICVPVIQDGNTIAQFTAKNIRSSFEKERACLLIWGEGGAGKTSLACQIAKWAMSDLEAERLCKHQMLPVLIEEELDVDSTASKPPLIAAIRGQMQDLTNEIEPISEELLERLLRRRRIIVIVDHFSEMSEATRKAIRPESPDFLVNALVITSRFEEKLGQVIKTTLKPLRIEGNRLSSFMEAYLTECGKREFFTDTEFFNACSRLSTMVGVRNITVLLAKLYAEQMIAAKEGTAADLPDNIPDLMLAYLNELNRDAADNEPDNRTIQQDAKAIAWECLKQTFRPTSAKLDDVLASMDASDDAEVRLKHLEKRLRLIQIISPAQDKIRFAIDPLAEYLAALHLVDCYKNDETLWRGFLAQAESMPDVEAIKGFLLAVLDCCLAKVIEVQVPDFVAEELAKLAGLDKISAVQLYLS
ncbi:MAG: PBS lyase [Hapalosiphonaceae cyanobacterium JJU2]|nr:MAG: PBS lyase [Hapalosiphonaceae cyanobacterium JJU2]